MVRWKSRHARRIRAIGLWSLYGEIWVDCPRCGAGLDRRVAAAPVSYKGEATAPARCGRCGHVGRYPVWVPPPAQAEGRDPPCRLPLHLRETVRGRGLWALNLRHVALLEAWLGASLRERNAEAPGQTMMARLPRWMKASVNRAALRAALTHLGARAMEPS
jgi:hypothetical protein